EELNQHHRDHDAARYHDHAVRPPVAGTHAVECLLKPALFDQLPIPEVKKFFQRLKFGCGGLLRGHGVPSEQVANASLTSLRSGDWKYEIPRESKSDAHQTDGPPNPGAARCTPIPAHAPEARRSLLHPRRETGVARP